MQSIRAQGCYETWRWNDWALALCHLAPLCYQESDLSLQLRNLNLSSHHALLSGVPVAPYFMHQPLVFYAVPYYRVVIWKYSLLIWHLMDHGTIFFKTDSYIIWQKKKKHGAIRKYSGAPIIQPCTWGLSKAKYLCSYPFLKADFNWSVQVWLMWPPAFARTNLKWRKEGAMPLQLLSTIL